MKLLSKKTIFIGAIVLIIVVAVMFSARNQRAAGNEYFTSTVEEGPLRNVVNATGVLQTVVTVQVGSQVSGQVSELHADYNSVVKRGQLLAKLDPRNFEAQVQNAEATVSASQAHVSSAQADIQTGQANVASAKASLDAARVTRDVNLLVFNRNKGMLGKGVVSQNDYDNAKANYDSGQAKYEQAVATIDQMAAQAASSDAALQQAKAQLQQSEAQLEQAKLNLGYCTIYSPVDGVVISRSIDVGQTLAASMQAPQLFSIANDLTQMQVNASVDEADIGNISSAEDVKFTVDAYPNDVFHAKIAEIRLSPQTVQNVVTYSVILSIDNSEMKLRPGMTATIIFTVDQRDKVVKIPNSALRYTPPGQAHPDAKVAGKTVPDAGRADAKASGAAADAAVPSSKIAADPTPLAPGQMWDPKQKIRFLVPKKRLERPGVIWVLDVQGKPQAHNVVLGISDGALSEVLSGDVKPGDQVVIGDSVRPVLRRHSEASLDSGVHRRPLAIAGVNDSDR